MHVTKIRQPKPWAEIKTKITQAYTQKWTQQWKNDIRFRQTKQFYSGPNSHTAKHIMKWGRIHVNQWVKAVTGHNNLAEHQARLDYEIDPQCRLCHDKPENTLHIL